MTVYTRYVHDHGRYHAYLDQAPPPSLCCCVVGTTLLLRLLLCFYIQDDGAIVGGSGEGSGTYVPAVVASRLVMIAYLIRAPGTKTSFVQSGLLCVHC